MAAFSIRLDKALGKRLRRIGSRRIERAGAALDRSAGGVEDAVHVARRRIKEARAVLRLSRAFLGKPAWRHFNRSLRAIARPLSAARDSTALVATLHGLSADKGPSPAPLRARLLDERQTEYRRLAPIWSELVQRASDLSDALKRQPVPARGRKGEWKLLAKGLTSSYRAGRRALLRARDQPTFENRHELRKRIKDLRYQCEVLRPLSPEGLKQQEDLAHRLTDLLGEDHDLAVLSDRLENGWADRDGSRLGREIAERRAMLWKEALPLAERLYTERTARFVERMKNQFANAMSTTP